MPPFPCIHCTSHLKHPLPGTSLMIQWLRLHTPNAEGSGLIHGQGTRSHMQQLRIHMSKLKILLAATKIDNLACHQRFGAAKINAFFFLIQERKRTSHLLSLALALRPHSEVMTALWRWNWQTPGHPSCETRPSPTAGTVLSPQEEALNC